MRIDKEHLYHGAAIIQVAEHPRFTTINAIKQPNRSLLRSAYQINSQIALFLKYAATRPKGEFREVQFTFTKSTLRQLRDLKNRKLRVFVGLVCVKARDICCVPLRLLSQMIEERRRAAGRPEPSYTIHVAIPRRGQFRVSPAQPGSKGGAPGDVRLIPRNTFPNGLFVK